MVRSKREGDARGRTEKCRHDEYVRLKQKKGRAEHEKSVAVKRKLEAQRLMEYRNSQSQEQKQLNQKKDAEGKKMTRNAQNAKALTSLAKELAGAPEKTNNDVQIGTYDTEPNVDEVEQLFWASSGIDKSAIDVREACTRGADMDGHFRAVFGNMVFSCAACGEVSVSDKGTEDFTIFRNDVAEAFSADCEFPPTSERGVPTRVNDKHYKLCLLKALVGGRLCQQKDLKDGHFYLCKSCAKCLSNKAKSPLWSIDLGYTADLPQLTPVEKAAIAASRIYGTLIKIKHRVAAEHQPLLLKGHLICFPHNAAEKLSEVVFPRTSVSELIQIHFIGSTAGWEKMQPILTQSGGILEVRSDVVRIWLQFLKENNSFYCSLKMDFSDSHFQLLQENVKKIITEAAITVDTTFDDAIGTTVGKEENQAEECGLPAVVVQDEGNIRTKEAAVKEAMRVIFCKRNRRRHQRV